MSNAARHWWGALLGVILVPAIAAALAYATWRTLSGRAQFGPTSNEYRIGLASFAVTALVLGIVIGSRLSPLASLFPGLALTAVGGLWAASPAWAAEHTGGKLPHSLDKLDAGYQSMGTTGLMLLVGAVLLFASLFPGRWRAREDLSPTFDYDGGRQTVPESLPYDQSQPYDQMPGYETAKPYDQMQGYDQTRYDHAPQYARPQGEEGPPPFGARHPGEEQPGFSAAPDWGTPRQDPPNQR
jgi:hypothetical protein